MATLQATIVVQDNQKRNSNHFMISQKRNATWQKSFVSCENSNVGMQINQNVTMALCKKSHMELKIARIDVTVGTWNLHKKQLNRNGKGENANCIGQFCSFMHTENN